MSHAINAPIRDFEQAFLDFGANEESGLPDDFSHLVQNNADQSGWFSILQNNPFKTDFRQRDSSGKKKIYKTVQHSYPLSYLSVVKNGMDRNLNSFISQSSFTKPNRQIVNLWRMGVVWVDLDTYKTEFGQFSIDNQVDMLLWYLYNIHGYPEPSMIVFSGRGLYAKWLHTPLPRAALPRWNAMMRQLTDSLSNFGADHAAKDASRVLRIVGTRNSRSESFAEVVHLKTGEDGRPYCYDFEYLAEVILPVDRMTIAENKALSEKRKQDYLNRYTQKTGRTEAGKVYPNLREISAHKLSWDRVEDLRRLVEMRKDSGQGIEGFRELMLFWQMDHLLLSRQVTLKSFWSESRTLAEELDSQWAMQEGHGTLNSLFAKAQKLIQGEKTITPDGREITPLYTPKNQSLIDIFKITPDEERQMKTIISRSVSRERTRIRDVDRHAQKRQESGAKAHADKKLQSDVISKIMNEGWSLRRAESHFGVSKSTIGRWLQKTQS